MTIDMRLTYDVMPHFVRFMIHSYPRQVRPSTLRMSLAFDNFLSCLFVFERNQRNQRFT
jgi:hypothetical protein